MPIGPDEILGRYDVAGRVSIYKQDQHGNVTFVLNQFGNVVEKYTYDAFGKPTIFDAYGNVLNDANGNPQSAIGNRFLFTGREYIQELSIYDYRHRMYMPGIGRFLQSDPTGFDAGDMNLFRYCGDDPEDRSDPTGLESEADLEQLSIRATLKAAKAYRTNNPEGLGQAVWGAH